MLAQRLVRLAVAPLVLVATTGPQSCLHAADATIDWQATRQSIDGFGACTAWYASSLTQGMMDTLYNPSTGIGLSILRHRINPDAINSDGTLKTSSLAAEVQATGRALTAAGAAASQLKIWASSWSPPAMWKDNNSINNGSFVMANAEAYSDWQAAYANYMRNSQGFTGFMGISAQNEPGSKPWEACNWTEDNLVTYSKLLATKLPAGVRLLANEGTSWGEVHPFTDKLLADLAPANHIIAGHYYTGRAYGNHTVRRYPNNSVWMTEFSYDSSTVEDATMTCGLKWAKDVWTMLVEDEIHAVHWWWIFGNTDAYQEGLIINDAQKTVPKRTWAYGNFSRFVRPGWVRMDATANKPKSGLYLAAFRHPSSGDFAIVWINDNTAASTTSLDLSGFTVSSLTPYLTDANNNLAAQSVIAVSGQTVTFSLPAKSVSTYVGTGTVSAATARPVAHAGADIYAYDHDATGSVAIHLDGSRSCNAASAVWKQGTTILSTQLNPTLSLPTGQHTLTLTVTGPLGDAATDTVLVDIQANGAMLAETFEAAPTGSPAPGWENDLGSSSSWSMGSTTASVGTGTTASKAHKGNQEPALRTLRRYDLTRIPSFDFSVDVLYAGSGTNTTGGFLGVGFSDNLSYSSPFTGGQRDRFLVGLALDGSATSFKLGSGGMLNNLSGTRLFGDAFALTANTWYRFTGTVAYSTSTQQVAYANLALASLGANGMATPSPVTLSQTNISFPLGNPPAIALDLDKASFVVVSNLARGISTFDNLILTPQASPGAGSNLAPTITSGEPASLITNEDTAGTLSLTATDADGDTLTWSIASQGTKGTASVSGTGSPKVVTYTPSANLNGSDSFVVQVSDGKGGVDSITTNVTITAINDTPLAAAQSVTATEDTATTITLSGSDIDGNALSYVLDANPGKGVLSGTAPNLTYTPSLNATGSDSFTFTVNDGIATSAAATVSITITAVNDAPVVAALISDQTATVGVAFSFVVPSGTCTDVDNAILTWSTNENLGWLTFDAATRTFSGTPGAGDAAATTITVTASDGNLSASDSFVLTVSTVANTPPIITTAGPATLATNEDTAGTLSLTATDADGDTVTWSIASQGAKGMATVGGSGSPTTMTYTPTANLNGSDSLVVQVSDGTGGVDTITVNVTITAVNDAPVVAAVIPDQTATVGVAFSFVVPSGTCTDVDNAILAWSTNENLGWLTFDAATRTFSGTPGAGDAAATTITVTASDGNLSASDSFVLTVSTAANTPPFITTADPATLATNEDTAGTLSLTATDADGDTLTWSIASQGAKGMATVGGSGSPTTMTYTPTANLNGSDSLVVQVSDGKGGVDTITVVIVITAVNDSPASLVAPTISGPSSVDRLQVATSGTWVDVDGAIVAYAYQWQRSMDGTAFADIVGATSDSYTPVADDIGFHLRVKVTATDNGTPGSAMGTAFSNATIVTGKTAAPQVASLDAQSTPLPSLSGTALPGATIRIYDGTTLLGTVLADSLGLWSWTQPSPLATGTHAIYVSSELAPMGESDRVGPMTVTVVATQTGGSLLGGASGGGGGCGAGSLGAILICSFFMIGMLTRGRP